MLTRYFLTTVLLFTTILATAQKYALLDKQMGHPVTFTNSVTAENTFAGFFPIEKNKLTEFAVALEKIAKQLTDAKKNPPEAFKFTLGTTTFTALKIALKDEDRLDVVLTANVGTVKSNFHLCDAKINNANNAFFVNTWARYIRGYIPNEGTK